MHSCSDKRELVRSTYASTPACKKDRTDPRCCLASGKGKEGEERRWRRHVFNTRVLQGLWWEQSKERERDEGKSESRASSSPGRKEEFPLASDCLTCKNAAFVAGLRSFFGRLSVTSCLLFHFLYSSVASRVSPPTQFLWILLGCRRTEELIGLQFRTSRRLLFQSNIFP